jgi:xanthine dehydrogenase molybdenum-binding subunit
MAAEVVGVSYEKVRVELNVDTFWQPWDWGSFASRANYVVGNAVIRAARDVKEKLLNFASKKFKVTTESLDIKDGKIYDIRDGKVYCTIAEIAHYITETSTEPTQLMGFSNFVPRENPPPSGVQIAEVEVDIETGEIFIKRIVALHDVGRAINPNIVLGQVHGGIVMGLGYALKEKLLWDETGKGILLTRNFTDYKIPTFNEVPLIELELIESNDPFGAFGAKGVGEPPSIPTAAAIANAVYNAIGVRIKELPITPEKVLLALESAGTTKG